MKNELCNVKNHLHLQNTSSFNVHSVKTFADTRGDKETHKKAGNYAHVYSDLMNG